MWVIAQPRCAAPGEKKIICIAKAGHTFFSLLEKNVEALRSREYELICLKEIVGIAGHGEISERIYRTHGAGGEWREIMLARTFNYWKPFRSDFRKWSC